MSWKEQALKKLAAEKKSAKYDRCAQVMKNRVCETLENFCCQNEEFAQAVVQGGSFEECMKAVAKNCGSGISDLDAFRRAARFYFPGSEVRFQMSIDLCGQSPSGSEGCDQDSGQEAVVLNLEDFR